MADSDGPRVGRAHIEITPKIETGKLQQELNQALKGAAKDLDSQLTKTLSKLPHTASKAIRDYQKLNEKQTREIAREADRAKALEKQRTAAQKAEERRIKAIQRERQKEIDDAAKAAKARFELQKKQIAQSAEAAKALAAQRDTALQQQKKAIEEIQKAEVAAYAMERKRKEAIQKAEIQAYAEDKKRQDAAQKDIERRIREIDAMTQKRLSIEKNASEEAKKIAKSHAADMDRIFRESALKGLGVPVTPTGGAGAAPGVPGLTKQAQAAAAELRTLHARGNATAAQLSKAFDKASHSMSQLSTRIGLGSFQLQLLGGMSTQFVSGPAIAGLASMGREGLKFATSIGYARASMEAILGPAEDVEKIIADIRKMAIESPLFNTEDAIGYAQKLAAVGVEGKDLYKSMQALSNIFLTQGVAGPERASLALQAYTQILSKGMIGMDDLRQQFAEHVPGGIKVFEEAAKILGRKTLEDLRDDMKAGKVSAEQLNEAFIKLGSSDKYLTGATKASATLGGVWQAFTEDMQATLGMAFDANREEIIKAIEGIRPVVMAFINWMAKSLPGFLRWLNELVMKARQIKAAYDALNPAQQELTRQIALLTIAAGPGAVAMGIFGTALSGVANAASFALKSLSMVGAAAGPVAAAAIFITTSLTLVAGALAYLYTRSEAVRKGVLKALNLIKTFISSMFLPSIDLLIGSIKSLVHQLKGFGLRSEHLAYVLGIVALPLVALTGVILLAVGAIKIFQVALLVLSSILYGLLNTLSMASWMANQFLQVMSHIPGPIGDAFEEASDRLGNFRKGMSEAIDVSKQWEVLGETNARTTEELQKKLEGTDLTVTGLSGVFGNWNNVMDQSIRKQITLEEALNNARKAMDSQASAARGAQDASDNWHKSVISLRESIKTNGTTLKENTKQGQANRDMLKAATQASYERMLQDIRSGVPMDQAINRHKKRTDQLKKEFGASEKTRKEVGKLIVLYGEVPKDVATLLKTMGYPDVAKKMQEIIAAQKVAANPKLSYDEALRNERKQWQLESKEGLKNGGVGKKAGGLIRGPGGPTGDKIPIMASDQEYMIRAKAAKNLGKPILDYLNRYGSLPIGGMYADGGQVNWPVTFDLSQTKFPEMLGGGPNSGGMGWQKMMTVLRQKFPGLPLISGYRPGAITSTGNRSYHAMGRAVDLPPRWDVFNWISQQYGRGTKELIFTPAGGRQIKNGRNHVFTGGTIKQDHYNHVHWAYDNGGYIPPDTPFINKTGAAELALNPSQGDALEEKIKNSNQPISIAVYVDGVRRDAEIVVDEKFADLVRLLGGE